jgi:hypothetical protein
MKKLGILGTMVWDRIYARDGRAEPIEEWGGIAYALAAAVAARPEDWELVPVLKVGRDLGHHATRFLNTLPELNLEIGTRVVAEPNNRVELRYLDRERRTERLTGGVAPWTWPELEPILPQLDALYINFISGFEMSLDTAQRMRLAFDGPIYADLHSLMLGVTPGGQRVPQPLAAWRDWLRCFDLMQLNEDELTWLANAWGDPWHFAAEVVGNDLKALLVTLGGRGAAYVAAPALRGHPLSWRHSSGLRTPPPIAVPGAAKSELVVLGEEAGEGDPTGCGDVWGATCFARMLAGDSLEEAMRAANGAAARNVAHRGASGLHHHLMGRIST